MDSLAEILLAVSNRLLVTGFDRFVPGGKQFIDWVGEPYIGGHSLDEGVKTVLDYHQRGILCTGDILGENVRTLAQAQRNLEAYVKIAGALRKVPATISAKPSSICVVKEKKDHVEFDPATTLDDRLYQLVVAMRNEGKKVTLDMEDVRYTDITLQAARNMWQRGISDPGIVLQTRLHRTLDDIRMLFWQTYPICGEQLRVRLCIGVYREPRKYAVSKEQAKSRIAPYAEVLFDQGVYVEFGTHEPRIIGQAVDLSQKKNIPKMAFEFQFLKGVYAAKDNIIAQLLRDGYIVRMYNPIELKFGDGHAYMVRRCAANPDFLGYAAKNLMKEVWSKGK